MPGTPSVQRAIRALTLEQKIAQLTGLFVTDLMTAPSEPGERFGLDTARLMTIRPHGVGHLSMAWFLGEDRDTLHRSLTRIQAAVRAITPLGIGALVHNEGINGFLHASGTQFTTAWGQAATWEPHLVERAAAVTSAHMGDAGIQLLLAPVMDLARDPRWGRVHETYGEDPELVAELSAAFVRGAQRDGDRVLAAGKHFLGYGASDGGLNQAATRLGRRALTDEYAEPFRRAIAESGLSAVMNSYNEIDGVPAGANRWLLTELLRDQLGFRGVVVSDYDAINLQRTIYHTAGSEAEAATQSIGAGLDVELPADANFRHLAGEVLAGRLDEKVVDLAVTRVLAIKERVGLLPGTRGVREPPPVDHREAGEVRHAIAERAMTLLKNDGVLPLAPGTRVLLVGPAADELRIHHGAYSAVSNIEMQLGSMALRDGTIPGIDPATFVFTDIFQTRMPGIEPTFEDAVRRLHPTARTLRQALDASSLQVDYATAGSFEATDPPTIDRAALTEMVGHAEVVIAAVGERTGWVGNNTAGEGQSTADPRLPGTQDALIAELSRSGKPLVTVLVSGRPLLISDIAARSDAVLLAPLLGELGGDAITAALTGAVNPSGKLPSSFPRSVGQIPIYVGQHYGSGYDHPTGTRHGYGDLTAQGPEYPFGHGLSYAAFDVGWAIEPPLAVALADRTFEIRVKVDNVSDVDGETVVQIYVRDEGASVVRPVRQLVAFQRVALPAGSTADVAIEIPLNRLHYTLPDGRRAIEPGPIAVMAGLSSADIRCDARIALTD